jgi:succinoglycan biosynthesis transport protein ExoP
MIGRIGYGVAMNEGVSEGRRLGMTGEQPIEMRRYMSALRRSWLFIVVFVAAIVAVAVVGSSLASKRYRASATIVVGNTFLDIGSTDVPSQQRQLETINQTLNTNRVLDEAAKVLPGETRDSLDHAISSSVDPNANIIKVTAKTGTPRSAANIANAVAQALLKTHAETETQGVASAKARLEQQLTLLRSSGAGTEEIQALRTRISDLVIAQANIGSDLQIAQPAEPPSQPFTPRPVRNGVIALFAGVFLAILIAIARDLVRPRITETRELARLMNLPVLARVPFTQSRFGRRAAVASAVAEEAYQTLQASIRYAHKEGRKIVVVTSALEKEGKTTTSIGLAQALARGGQKTLLICADFRLPTLHERLGIKRSPGLSDLLRTASSPTSVVKDVRRVTRTIQGFGAGSLDVIPSGSRVMNPAELLFGGAFDTFLTALGLLEYDHVVIDGPPLLGIADGHVLAQRADSVIVVARPDRLSVEQALEVREKLDRLQANTLGLVVCGRFRNVSAYGYVYAQSALTTIGAGADEGVLPEENGRGIVTDSASRRRSGASRQPR